MDFFLTLQGEQTLVGAKWTLISRLRMPNLALQRMRCKQRAAELRQWNSRSSARSETSRQSPRAEGCTSGAIWTARTAKAAGARRKEKQSCNLPMGQSVKLRYTGLKRMGSDGRISKSRGYSNE